MSGDILNDKKLSDERLLNAVVFISKGPDASYQMERRACKVLKESWQGHSWMDRNH